MAAQHCSVSGYGALPIAVIVLVQAATGQADAVGSTSDDEPPRHGIADDRVGMVYLSSAVSGTYDKVGVMCRCERCGGPDGMCQQRLSTGTSAKLSAARIIQSMCFSAAFILIRIAADVFRDARCRAPQGVGEPQLRDDPIKSRHVNSGKSRVVPHSIFSSLLFLVVIISLLRGGSAQQVRYVRVTADAAQNYLAISYLCVCDNVGACDENSNQLSKDKVATATSTLTGSDATQVTKGTAGNRNFGNVCHSAFFTTFPSHLRPLFHDFHPILAIINIFPDNVAC